jgi:hypothetical protein
LSIAEWGSIATLIFWHGCLSIFGKCGCFF